MINATNRKEAIKLIDEAKVQGASLSAACKELNIHPRTYNRWKVSLDDKRPTAIRPTPKSKITKEEKKEIIKVANTPKYKDLPPSQIVPMLADEGIYIASESTFYRVLKEEKMNTKRISTRNINAKVITTHTANKPNRLWSWDITWLPGPVKGHYFKLYLILDIFSRYIVGWEIWNEELSLHAQTLIKKAAFKHKLINEPLVLHSDNGSPMKAQNFQVLLEKLEITKSYSRPRVSNDNAYSESLFRTLKYSKDFPFKGFKTIKDARSWIFDFVKFYNTNSRHSGVKFVTPYERHYGYDSEILEKRKNVYNKAKLRNPSRWSSNIRDWNRIETVSLNPTTKEEENIQFKKII